MKANNLSSKKIQNINLGIAEEIDFKKNEINYKTVISNKSKKKTIILGKIDNEYYDQFLQNLVEEKKEKSNNQESQILKQTMKITRRKKSKSLKINKTEENKLKSTFNSMGKNKMKTLLKKSLLKKGNFFLKSEKSDSSNLSKKSSLKMMNNIQFSIEETPKKNNNYPFSSFRNSLYNNKNEEKENKSNEITKENINFIDNPEMFYSSPYIKNPFEKRFGKYKLNDRTKTFSYSKLDDKKREKINNNFIHIEKIIPIQADFISNATRLDFSKKNTMNKEEKNENNFKKCENELSNKNSQIISIYSIKDNKKTKSLLCCCLPINL